MKKIVSLVAVLLIAVFVGQQAMATPKVLMMVPNDFWWTEYSEPVAQYKEAGFEVIIATKAKSAANPDLRNTSGESKIAGAGPIQGDISFKEVVVADYDAITFVAGNGAWHDFFPNQTVHDIVTETMKIDKPLGLICASTGLLGLVGNWNGMEEPIAKGRRATGYFRVEGLMRNLGQVDFVEGGPKDDTVVVDGNLITGRNPQSSKSFGAAIVNLLK